MSKCFYQISTIICVSMFASVGARAQDSQNAPNSRSERQGEVIVYGEGSPSRHQNRAGSTTIVRPTEETQFDAGVQLNLDPSLTTTDPSTGFAGGFSLPLFRGHDVRSTHVFLDDIELQDPFTGFPLMEDVDLRSFGEMRIHKGLAPWDVSSASPGGVVQFLSRRIVESSAQLGLNSGNVRGQSGWLETEAASDHWTGKIYGRRHIAKGDYEIYSDNGTVRNVEDDTVRRRSNNEQSSTLTTAASTIETESTTSKIFGWNQEGERGLPVRQTSGDGNARVKTHTSLLSLSSVYDATSTIQLGVSGQRLQTRRNFRDPGQTIGRAYERSLQTCTTRGGMHAEQRTDFLSWLLSAKRTTVDVQAEQGDRDDRFAPRFGATSLYGGTLWRPLSTWSFELKSDRLILDDRSQSGNLGVTSMYQMKSMSVWAQAAKHERAPSLLERSGNGAEMVGNDALFAESGLFGELGVRGANIFRGNWQGERSLAFWIDDIKDRIHTLPISATQWKSLNVRREFYRGVEVRERWWVGRWSIEFAAAMTRATAESGLLLPQVSLWQGVIAPMVSLNENWKIRTTSRYSGRFYSDFDNTSEVGESWVHDVTLDRFEPRSFWALGLSVQNMTDVKSLPVRDVATGQTDGRIALESKNHEPLPGRQWLVRWSAKI